MDALDAVWGESFTLEGKETRGMLSPVDEVERLSHGHLHEECEARLHLKKSDWPEKPGQGATFKLRGKSWRILEISDDQFGNQWVLQVADENR